MHTVDYRPSRVKIVDRQRDIRKCWLDWLLRLGLVWFGLAGRREGEGGEKTDEIGSERKGRWEVRYSGGYEREFRVEG